MPTWRGSVTSTLNNVTGATVLYRPVPFTEQAAMAGLSYSSGTWTCAVAGTYLIGASLYSTGGAASNEGVWIGLYKNGSIYMGSHCYEIDQYAAGAHLSCGIELSVSDTIDIGYQVGAGSQVHDIGADGRISVCRITKLF